MATSWPEIRLGDVVTDITVGFVSSMTQEYKPVGVPFLRSQDVKPHRIDPVDLKFISRDFHKKLSKSALSPGDVVVVRTGAPGTAAVIPDFLPEANCADLVIIRPGPRVVPRFLAYFFNSQVGRAHVKAQTVGAVQQHFNVGAAREARLCLPSLKEQVGIGDVLGTLDDRIALNSRMNHTLEATAQALFKSWFVDFDPVRAKADGRQPWGMDADTAAMFADKLVESDGAAIPEGWSFRPASEEFDITMGQSPPGSTYNELAQGLPFFQGRADFGFRFPTNRIFCTAPKRFANEGDTLVSVRAPVGDINIAIERCAIGRGVAAVRHKSKDASFTYYSMRALREDFAVFESEGTVFGCIGKKDFHALRVVAPTQKVLERFGFVCGPLDARLRLNELESQTLASIRDLLLPKLLSGELRVKDADATVAEVV